MNTREKFSVGFLCLGFILALLPLSANRSFTVKPQKLLSEVLDEKTYFTVDQVAGFVVSEDTTVQIIDLRSPEEFRSVNIPGSINVPYDQLLNNDFQNICKLISLNNGIYQMHFFPCSLCLHHCCSITASVKSLYEFWPPLVCKNPYHLNPHRKFLLNNHPNKITRCKTGGICNVIDIVIEVLHYLADGNNPYQDFKKIRE